MITVRLKQGRERSLENRHPWLFSGAIAGVEGSMTPGELALIVDAQGVRRAWGYHNSRSQITVRILSWDVTETIDQAFFRRRLEASIARRQTLPGLADSTACRLVNAESDGLPGLIVDCYGEWLVLQSLTAGIERRKQEIADLLMELLQPRGIYERSDVDVRAREGLAGVAGPLAASTPTTGQIAGAGATVSRGPGAGAQDRLLPGSAREPGARGGLLRRRRGAERLFLYRRFWRLCGHCGRGPGRQSR